MLTIFNNSLKSIYTTVYYTFATKLLIVIFYSGLCSKKLQDAHRPNSDFHGQNLPTCLDSQNDNGTL